MVSVGYISSCSSLNFFNLINLGSSMGIPYSRGILQCWSNKCFIGMRFYIRRFNLINIDKVQNIVNRNVLNLYNRIFKIESPARSLMQCLLARYITSLLLYEPYANESSQICPFLAVRPQFESVTAAGLTRSPLYLIGDAASRCGLSRVGYFISLNGRRPLNGHPPSMALQFLEPFLDTAHRGIST